MYFLSLVWYSPDLVWYTAGNKQPLVKVSWCFIDVIRRLIMQHSDPQWFINLYVFNHNMIIYNHLSTVLTVDYSEKSDNIHSNNVFRPNRRISKNVRYPFSRHCKLNSSSSRIQIEFVGIVYSGRCFFNLWTYFYREDAYSQKQASVDEQNRFFKNLSKFTGKHPWSIFPGVGSHRIFVKNGKLHNRSIKQLPQFTLNRSICNKELIRCIRITH